MHRRLARTMSPASRAAFTRAVTRAVTRAATTASLALASLALAACGSDGGSPEVRTPSRIELVGVAPAAAVNSMVTPPPSVRVSDAEGRPVANVNVTFTAVGGGTMTDGVQRTDAQGIATVGSWRLGTAAGSGNTLVATAGTLTTTITAMASAGAAASHEAAPGQPASQSVQPSSAVATRPAVRVTDSYGNPKSGVVVTFAPGTNSGTVTGGLQTTNAEGIATVGSWTVGTASGRQTLVANVSGGALPPVTFVANVGGGDPAACTSTPYTLGTTVAGSLATTDCPFGDGSFVDYYEVSSASMINHDFRLASTAFDAYLWARTTSGTTVAAADDESPSTTNARMRLIAPAGTYRILANSYDPAETGAYTLSSSGGTRAVGCDQDSWIVPGVTFGESIATTDCAETNGAGTYGDVYFVVLTAGRSGTVTMRSSAVNAYLRVLRFTGTDFVPAGQDDNSAGGTDARVTVTAPPSTAENIFAILATTAATNPTSGAYTLEVTAPASLVAGGRAGAPAGGPTLVGLRPAKGAALRWPTAPWSVSPVRGAARR